MMNMKKLKKSAVFGLYTVLVGTIVSMVMKGSFEVKLPGICQGWNKYHVMEICLFFTGMIVFLTFDMAMSKISPLAKMLA